MSEASLIIPSFFLSLSLPFPHLPSHPANILFLYLPLEGKTKGMGEVTWIVVGER